MRKILLTSLLKAPLTEPGPKAGDAELIALAAEVGQAASLQLGRSLSIRQIDAGSCNACELEINALSNAFYDLERFGLRFVASPRHADVLLVTGPVTKNMREALLRTYDATPAPKWVVATGACALDVYSPAAMPVSAAFPRSFAWICTFPAVRLPRWRFSKACSHS